MLDNVLQHLRSGLEGSPIVRDHLCGETPSCGEALEAPNERLYCQVWDYFQVNCSHDAAGVEADPHLGLPGTVDIFDEKRAGKIDTCVSKRRSLLNSECRQWWWRWSIVRSSFEAATGNTPV